MKLSKYFLPVLKEFPAEANIISHQLMLRCGMIKQTTAGIYSWLPLGFKVLKKIEEIVHDEHISPVVRREPRELRLQVAQISLLRSACSCRAMGSVHCAQDMLAIAGEAPLLARKRL